MQNMQDIPPPPVGWLCTIIMGPCCSSASNSCMRRNKEANFPPDLLMKLWKSKVGGGCGGSAIKGAGG